MKRRDYLLIARALSKAFTVPNLTPDRRRGLAHAVTFIGDALEEDSKAFDRQEFLRNVYQTNQPNVSG
jgi:hypothetical protein